MIRNNPNIEDLQLNGCYNAVDDTSMRLISGLEHLTFLDVSYAKKLTDKGLMNFNEKTVALQSIVMNDCSGITSLGMIALINSCQQTLLDFEVANNDQPDVNNTFMAKLAMCWNLESLDITGCVNVDDQGFAALSKGEAQLRVGVSPIVPGLIKMNTCKVGHTKMTDYGLQCLIKTCPALIHLELNRNEITDNGVKLFAKEMPMLKFLDLTSVSGITLAILDEIKLKKPELLLRQFTAGKFDPKDNGLRVPRRVEEKKEKKKGKKKK